MTVVPVILRTFDVGSLLIRAIHLPIGLLSCLRHTSSIHGSYMIKAKGGLVSRLKSHYWCKCTCWSKWDYACM